MSREQVMLDANWAVYVGRDHLTGVFLQIWKAPEEEQEGALLIIDNRGVQVNGVTVRLILSDLQLGALLSAGFTDRMIRAVIWAMQGHYGGRVMEIEEVFEFSQRSQLPLSPQKILKALGK